MARSQQRSNRKASGARYKPGRAKKSYEVAGFAANTRLLDKIKVRVQRILGGNTKRSLLSSNMINVAQKGAKSAKAQILNVVENPANPHLVRRNVLTKGAIVETKLGKVRVTSRPGQEGVLNGVLVK
jgi:small subunit ribosomal protein S8e